MNRRKPIGTIDSLCWVLGIPEKQLMYFADTARKHYTEFAVPKAYGYRMIKNPRPGLKAVQLRIYENILRDLPLPDSVHGGVKDRSPKSNAAQHCGQPCVVRLDVKKCFPSIKPALVYRLFAHHLKFAPDVARVLTKLTTLDRQVPQGVSTSTAIVNLVISYECEEEIAEAVRASRSKNTRFVDDLFFSGNTPQDVIN